MQTFGPRCRPTLHTMRSTCRRHRTSRSFSHEMSTPDNQDPLAGARMQCESHLPNRSIGRLSETITRRQNSLFGHVATELPKTHCSAHQALRCSHVDLSLGGPRDQAWRRCPGRPRSRWLDLPRSTDNTPPADLWRLETSHIYLTRTPGADATVIANYALMTTRLFVFKSVFFGQTLMTIRSSSKRRLHTSARKQQSLILSRQVTVSTIFKSESIYNIQRAIEISLSINYCNCSLLILL